MLKVFQYIDFRNNYDAAFTRLFRRLQLLEREHLYFLQMILNAYEEAQGNASIPERFEYKISSLRTIIENWEVRHELELGDIHLQQDRVARELEQEREKLSKAHKEPVNSVGIRVIGQRLSSATDYFVDRDVERAKVEMLLMKPFTRIVSIVGRGGIGKTALVSKVLGDLELNYRSYSKAWFKESRNQCDNWGKSCQKHP